MTDAATAWEALLKRDGSVLQVARQFKRAQTRAVQPLLESLAALGQARTVEGGRFAA